MIPKSKVAPIAVLVASIGALGNTGVAVAVALWDIHPNTVDSYFLACAGSSSLSLVGGVVAVIATFAQRKQGAPLRWAMIGSVIAIASVLFAIGIFGILAFAGWG